MTRLSWIWSALVAVGLGTAGASPLIAAPASQVPARAVSKVVRSEAEWKQLLTPQQFRVLREKGTDLAHTGKYVQEKKAGTYRCAGCGLELFSSATKFESGTGWPSFWKPIAAAHVGEVADTTHGMTRTEVICNRCGGHIGHVFDDGPEPTGLRYCLNSSALAFLPKK